MDALPINNSDTSATLAPEQPERRPRPIKFRHRLEYYAAVSILKLLGVLPHRVARPVCAMLAMLSYWLWPRLRKVGLFNLRLAFPEWPEKKRRQVLSGLFHNFGRMLADFAHFPRWNRQNIERLIIYDGFENYARAQSLGRGVFFLTAHFGNWELGSFAHGVYGYPCNFVVRELDNPLIDRLINRYRCLSGGKAIEKRDFAREVLRTFARGAAVGVLMDQNMAAGEGAFVDFFGQSACTTTGPARVAKRTGVPIVLGLVIWDAKLKKYRLRFDPVEWVRREDAEEEIVANTAHFTHLLEQYVRRYPEQWLWVHKRWKTRPPGEPPLYPF
jgi:KDO2-lipid IV(A) lauroyltransferase